MMIIIDILIASSILGSVVTSQIVISSDQPGVTYEYSMETDDKVQRCIGWGQSMIIYVEDGRTFLILSVIVHNEKSEPIFVEPSCFRWHVHDTDVLALNYKIHYWGHIDPYLHPTSGYIQSGESWELEVIFDIPTNMMDGELLSWDSDWQIKS